MSVQPNELSTRSQVSRRELDGLTGEDILHRGEGSPRMLMMIPVKRYRIREEPPIRLQVGSP
jgi:hypothetical protein